MTVWQHYCLGKLHQHISAKPRLGAAEFSLLHTALCLVSSPAHMHPLSACNCGSSLQNKPSCRFVLNPTAPHRPRGHWLIKQTAQECSGSSSTQANQNQWGESFYTYSFFGISTPVTRPSWVHCGRGVHPGLSLKLPIELNHGVWKKPLGDQKCLLVCHLMGGSPGAAVSSCVFSEEVLQEVSRCSWQHLLKAADRPLGSY